MAASKIIMQSADGASVGLTIPDGVASGERQISLGANLSGITAYHLLQGNLAVSNSTITKGFGTTLYTSGSAVTDIDMNTQWGNTAEERFGGLVWLKDRAEATNNFLYDTVRGATKEINTNTTEAEATLAGGLTGFTSTGFTVGADAGHNSTTSNMVSWNFQTTHRISGTTNHGKAIVNHYNPFTGFGIAVYTGSGIAGHDIQTMLGRKVAFATIKNLSAVLDWLAQYRENNYMYLNLTNAETTSDTVITNLNDNSMTLGISATCNTLNQQYVVYYWANSYFDESNKLIGNYELVTYQGTGAVGNKVTTKGKPAWVMIKRVDAVSSWYVSDNQRADGKLYANTSGIEVSEWAIPFKVDGFVHNDSTSPINVAGGQYIALVAYDTNSNGGGSYYPLASDTANVQINNALIPFANGVDGNGAKNTILSKNETITGLTYTQGKNYVYCDKNGSYGVTSYKPRYSESELVRTFASEAPEYYDVVKNKWFITSGHGELVTNGTGLSLTGWIGKDVNSGFPDSILSLSNQTIVITNSSTAGSNGAAYQLLTGLTVGKKYKVKLSQDGTVLIQVGTTSYLASVRYAVSLVGATDFEFIAQATSVYLTFYNSVSTANDSCWIDNISCFATEIVPTTEITNSRNYLNHIVHADSDGGVLYVEELPKIEYKDIVKANEFKGKNACTAWANIDMTTTPPTIRDSYGIASIIRTGTGTARLFFTQPMDDLGYSFKGNASWVAGEEGNVVYFTNKTLAYVDIVTGIPGTASSTTLTPRSIKFDFEITGGRN